MNLFVATQTATSGYRWSGHARLPLQDNLPILERSLLESPTDIGSQELFVTSLKTSPRVAEHRQAVPRKH